MDDRDQGLLAWQFALYPENHTNRRNLVLHALTVPLFLVGILSIPATIGLGRPLFAIGGLVAVGLAVALQGRGHKLETKPPVPFRSPFDAVARLVVEQFVTFPRFVAAGGFSRAWRAAGESPTTTTRS